MSTGYTLPSAESPGARENAARAANLARETFGKHLGEFAWTKIEDSAMEFWRCRDCKSRGALDGDGDTWPIDHATETGHTVMTAYVHMITKEGTVH
jgi:hypothetical protein